MSDEERQSNAPPGAAQKDAHGQTQNIEAFKRKLHERIGAWLAGHWTQIVSAAAGVVGGAFAMYLLFASQINDAARAAADAKQAAALLGAKVDQLVTQQQLNTALERIARLEEDYHVAYQEAGKPPVPPPRRRK